MSLFIVPSVGTIKDGEVVNIECVDWTGGQIKNNDDADDVKDVDLTQIHYLSGPFEVPGAEPGDMLVVEIVDLQPFPDQLWGYTGVFDANNGGGFLDEIYPHAWVHSDSTSRVSRPTQCWTNECSAKAIWDFEGIYATSRHIPHVRFPGIVHPGQLGCAPSAEVLAEWNKRETELIKTTDLQRVVALPPDPEHTHPGSGEGEIKKKVQEEGARTIPCRPEHGGNCDIKNLSKGSRVWLPVHVNGGKFSVGDLHFSRTWFSPSSYASNVVPLEKNFVSALTISSKKAMRRSPSVARLKSLAPSPSKQAWWKMAWKSSALPHQYTSQVVWNLSIVRDDSLPLRDSVWMRLASSTTWMQPYPIAKRYYGALPTWRDMVLDLDLVEGKESASWLIFHSGYDDYQCYLLLSCVPVQAHIAGIVDVRKLRIERLYAESIANIYDLQIPNCCT